MPESDLETIERRLDAVERAIADDQSVQAPQQPASDGDADLSDRLETLETRVDELDAAVQSVRGFLGGVDAVNERVEARAEAAIAAVERLERQFEERGLETAETNRDDANDEPGADGRTVDSRSGTAQRSLGERLREQW